MFFFFFQAEDGIRDIGVTGVQTCALPISPVTTATGSTDVAASAAAERRALRRHSPWRDRRYLALAALSAVFGMQFGVGEIGVPLWIANHTEAPEVLVAAALILNTVIVVLFQVPLARGTHDLRKAG